MQTRKKLRGIIALLGILLSLAAAAGAMAEDAPILQVHQMKLGCADGYLIRYGDINILVDGGNPLPLKPSTAVVDYLRSAGVERLDACIVTHWHLDHCMELNDVLAAFGDGDTVVYGPSEQLIASASNPLVSVPMAPLAAGTYRQMKMGDVLTFTSGGGEIRFHCVGPAEVKQNGACNQDSLNFVLQYGRRKMLFTGDYAAGRSINSTYAELCRDVDVLKFPHHGIMPYAITAATARTLHAQIVVVPGMGNRYELWSFFDNNGAKMPREQLYTDSDAPLVILTDGAELLEVRTQQDPRDYAPEKPV